MALREFLRRVKLLSSRTVSVVNLFMLFYLLFSLINIRAREAEKELIFSIKSAIGI